MSLILSIIHFLFVPQASAVKSGFDHSDEFTIANEEIDKRTLISYVTIILANTVIFGMFITGILNGENLFFRATAAVLAVSTLVNGVAVFGRYIQLGESAKVIIAGIPWIASVLYFLWLEYPFVVLMFAGM